MRCSQILNRGYTEPVGGSGFNEIGGHEFQRDVLRSSIEFIQTVGGSGFNEIDGQEFQRDVLRSSTEAIQSLWVDLVLMRLVDMSSSEMFSDPQ